MNKTRKNKNQKSISKFITYENLDKIGETAVYYGFQPAKSPLITKADLDIAKTISESDYVDDETESHGRLPLHVEEKIAIIRNYQENNMYSLPQPIMFYFKDQIKNPSKKNNDPFLADLEILGSSGSIVEATLIQCARMILNEEGYKNTTVEINSTGDKDSIAKFTRELISYYRKHINELSAEGRQILKRDPFEVLNSKEPSCMEINKHAPHSIDFLNENSKKHLEEVLEYFESLGIPYFINNNLIGNRVYCTETIYTILNSDQNDPRSKNQHVLAFGSRYSGIAKRMNVKRDVAGASITLLIKAKDKNSKKPVQKMKKPIASFVQLSIESKLLSLYVIEILRKAKFPLHLSLSKDRLGAQVSSVEKYHTPYVIVMGKKEAVEKNVIVRHNDSHSQQIISIEELPKYMKKIEDEYYKGK